MISPAVFWVLTFLVLGAAIAVVTARNIFHAGLALTTTFVGVAGFYLALRADFLAVVQILVYAGAIAVLILFAILMTHRVGETEPVQNSLAGLAFFVVVPLLGALGTTVVLTFSSAVMTPQPAGTQLARIGERLLQSFGLPFELISVVLLAAMIGAIIVAREDKP